MNIHYYTSITYSYLSRALVLHETVRKYHPEWTSWLIVSDRPPSDAIGVEKFGYDHVLYIDDFSDQFSKSFIFMHNIVEMCTAVKGEALRKIMASGADAVLYIDPDIALFNPMNVVIKELQDKSIVLTPHITDPQFGNMAISDNELGSLKHGIFNLGFIGVKNDHEGRRFANWWADRLSIACYEETWSGVYTDQKWCDLVPCFFESVGIVRHNGCNVASWNLSNRHVHFNSEGQLRVSDDELIFYHFTKIKGPGFAMTDRYVGGSVAVYDLVKWYGSAIEFHKYGSIHSQPWAFGYYSDGTEIPLNARRKYRARSDLQQAFPDPFQSGSSTFCEWLRHHGDEI
ncbi:hypothetical protein [Methylobacterium aerolatum]|uniref:Glycosyl transferase n=1 Tax=Methylobacterium aerolatum TaxID=418708 RepID=A0ABU0I5Z0_9HYPH|nr:hypothetical protein [Methylobacterium aerolatum]MDQ0450039.1 hypothetical protein [Methylobacterium aerolatum]GJD37373.1 hypothetical protein FMGBMHLM_4303 [Methylobacterium aerolatum]